MLIGDYDSTMHHLVDRMFQLDHLGVQDLVSIPNDEFDKQFKSKISFSNDDQQYVAPLPWKNEHPPLPTNLCQSLARLTQLRDRLLHLDLFDQYAKVLQSHEANGYIERVAENEESVNRAHYLPHFFVLKPQSATTPLRIVFAANFGKTSLNNCLETGPCLLNDLLQIMLKFRVYKYAFTADIAKAFLNILIASADRDFLRFLWFEDNDPNGRVVHFRYRCLNFGPTCAPYILNTTIRKHLECNPSRVTDDMCDKLYVDNLVTGTHSEDDAVQYYSEATGVCTKATMPLRQWLSNSPKLMKEAYRDEVAVQSNSVSVLGIQWDAVDDCLLFPAKQLAISESHPHTKRSLLSKCSSLFDPFGFLSPVTMPVKLLISELWDEQYGWDDPLPLEITTQFDEKLSDLQCASDHFHISRPFSINHRLPAEIHLFCDASFVGLGCVVYLVQNETVAFVMSKLQIISRKKKATLTVPKLELMAMLLGAKLLTFCIKHLEAEYAKLTQYCWTDSEICLHWLHSLNQSNVFVRNRVRQIKDLSDVSAWSHVRSEDNPADIITRGSNYELLLSSRFHCGPAWLTDISTRPHAFKESRSSMTPDDPGEITSACATTTMISLKDLIDVQRFSSYQTLLVTVAFVLRFVELTRRKTYCATDSSPSFSFGIIFF